MHRGPGTEVPSRGSGRKGPDGLRLAARDHHEEVLVPATQGPALGAHSEDILAEAGIAPDVIAALKASGAVG